MRIGVIPSNPVEKMVLKLNMVPEPMLTTQMAFTMARAIMAGVDVGVFEALADGPLSSERVAERCQTDLKATTALLRALVGCGYLGYNKRGRAFSLKRGTRKWLLRDSQYSLTNKMLLQKFEWEFLGNLENYVKSGQPMNLHSNSAHDVWASYQAGMVDIGRLALPEILKRTPLPKGATRMLDIGGSGGTYSAAFVRRHPKLAARILDLPEAVTHAKPFVERHHLGERLKIAAGNVLTDDLGQGLYDFVFMGNVAHHLSEEQNVGVARKVLAALKPSGVFAIVEFERSDDPSAKNQMGSLMDLYFAFTSESGTWSCGEMVGWLKEAGLKAGRPIRMRSSPGMVMVWGRKS